MSQKQPLLLIEDALSLRMIYHSILTRAGYEVILAGTGSEGIKQFREHNPVVVLLDLMLPDRDGLELMAQMRQEDPSTVVVVITSNGSINKAVEAMRAGAHEFLVKPFDEGSFLHAVENALKSRRTAIPRSEGLPPHIPPQRQASVASPPRPPLKPLRNEENGFIGSSPALTEVMQKIRSVASSMATVFITGESGTGKELCALAVHRQSSRADGPFIALNCGAIPADLLESEVFGHVKGSFTGAISDKIGAAAAADGGTLFLDEVCEMLPALQTKLLRFLQTSTVTPVGATKPRKVNVRIICATNRDPAEAVRLGQFREDLYYRLYVVPVHMPPLRARGDDVIEIAEHALRHYGAEEGHPFTGLSDEVRALFRELPWPGNIRQLLNVMRNVAVLYHGPEVELSMLPPELRSPRPLAQSPIQAAKPLSSTDRYQALLVEPLAVIERTIIEAVLERYEGSVPRAARSLEIAPSTLYRKIESWKKA